MNKYNARHSPVYYDVRTITNHWSLVAGRNGYLNSTKEAYLYHDER